MLFVKGKVGEAGLLGHVDGGLQPRAQILRAVRVRAEGQDFSAQLAEELDIFQRRGGLADLPAQARRC